MNSRLAPFAILLMWVGVSFGDLAGITLNEVNPSPNLSPMFDTDGNGTIDAAQDEFIEFANSTAAPIDVDTWQIFVSSGDAMSGFNLVQRATFGDGITNSITSIPASGFVAMVNNWQTTVPSNVIDLDKNTATLSNNGGQIVLLDPGTNEYASWTYNAFAPITSGLPSGATLIGSNIEIGTQAAPNLGNGFSASPDFQETTYVDNIAPTPAAMNVVPEPSAFLVLNFLALVFAGRSWASRLS